MNELRNMCVPPQGMMAFLLLSGKAMESSFWRRGPACEPIGVPLFWKSAVSLRSPYIPPGKQRGWVELTEDGEHDVLELGGRDTLSRKRDRCLLSHNGFTGSPLSADLDVLLVREIAIVDTRGRHNGLEPLNVLDARLLVSDCGHLVSLPR